VRKQKLIWLVSLVGLTFWLTGCGKMYVFPSPRPGMVIPSNHSPAEREIRFFPKYHSLEQLKRVDAYRNEILAIPPLRLLWLGEETRQLIFKSEEILFPEDRGILVSKFNLPCSFPLYQGSQMPGQSAVICLRPSSPYTLYVRDLGINGGLLPNGEHIIHFQTSNTGTRDYRKTYSGTIWADRIIDLPPADTSGPHRLQLKILINPWNVPLREAE